MYKKNLINIVHIITIIENIRKSSYCTIITINGNFTLRQHFNLEFGTWSVLYYYNVNKICFIFSAVLLLITDINQQNEHLIVSRKDI